MKKNGLQKMQFEISTYVLTCKMFKNVIIFDNFMTGILHMNCKVQSPLLVFVPVFYSSN